MSTHSGKGKSQSNPNGKRHTEAKTGKQLAPRSVRAQKRYLDDCTAEDLQKANVTR